MWIILNRAAAFADEAAHSRYRSAISCKRNARQKVLDLSRAANRAHE